MGAGYELRTGSLSLHGDARRALREADHAVLRRKHAHTLGGMRAVLGSTL